MLVGDDEAWLIYGIASHEATHQIADELFDDYIVVPDNLLALLDSYLALLQDGYLVERNIGGKLVL